MTPTEIATGTRLPVNQVSSQLKRLSEAGYVHTANIRGRSSYYTLSEPLYAIWHQMRFGRDARKRMNWLVAFLKNWYDAKELGTECERLQQIFHSYLIAGRQHEARGALEHRRYLMEAIEDSDTRASTFESVVLDYLELSDIDTLKSDVLIDVDINDLSQETQRLLVNAGLVIDERVKLRLGSQLTDQRLQAEAAANLELAIIALNSGLPEEATARLQNILNLDPYDFEANLYLAIIEAFIGKSDESSARFAELEKNLTPDSPNSLMLRSAKAYIDNRADDTIQHLDEMLRRGASKRAWHMKALLLKRAHRPEEAIQAIRNIAEEERDFDSWYTLAELLEDLDRNEAAVETLDQAIKHSPQSVDALRMKSRILFKLGRYDEALVFTDRVLSIKSDSAVDWFSRGAILINNESLEEAVKSLERGIELSPKFTPGLLLNAVILRRLGRTDQSHLYLNKVLELDPECVDAHLLRATLSASTNLEESMASVRQAFAIKDRSRSYLSDLPVTMAFRAILSALGNDVKGFKSAWNDLLQSSDRHSNRTEWLSGAANALRGLAVAGQWSLARELITSSQLDEELFPLARALDYLQTNEEALIEKLSPEVRQIVIEIVTTLTLETSRVREKQRKKRSKKSGIKKQIKN
ncbi:MAG TPA: tetratricopeptide repeat protein [Anaerolineales bacterium]|nr:tetratricopeptide repeat protein [Anaerolineales bacterium]